MDWLSDYFPAVLVGLTVAGLGFVFADGGRRRRALRLIKEELEVLEVLDLVAARGLPERSRALWEAMIRADLATYARPPLDRRYQRSKAAFAAASVLAVATTAVWYIVINITGLVDEDVTLLRVLAPLAAIALQLAAFAWNAKVAFDRMAARRMQRRRLKGRALRRLLPDPDGGAEHPEGS